MRPLVDYALLAIEAAAVIGSAVAFSIAAYLLANLGV